jgi:hypothetical protein
VLDGADAIGGAFLTLPSSEIVPSEAFARDPDLSLRDGELANGPKIAFSWLDHSKKAARPIEPVLETAGLLPGSHLG